MTYPTNRNRWPPVTFESPGMRSTPGSRRADGWCTIRPTRTTGWTAGPPAAGCGSTWPGPSWVDTTDTVIVFETALQPRLYVSPKHVRTDLLTRSGTASYCNYKGTATYWSATIGDEVIADVAWSYDEPLPESLAIKGFLSFDQDRTDVAAELPLGGE